MAKKINLPVINPLIQDDKRKYLFIPCKTKEELKNWIYVYLGLDYPDGRVDPASNSDPMSLVWELYSAATDTERRWERLLGYASRFSFKTLSAAILELLFLVHHGRDISHMSAIESQASNCVQYIKKFLQLPIFFGFLSKDNTRELFFTRFFDPITQMSFSEKEIQFLPAEIRSRLQNITNSMKIIVATTASANGLHTNLTVLDEIDLIANKEAYAEAKMIPTESNGFPPVTFLTSTRKYSIGLVQKEIDEAQESGIEIRHWNILDVTEKSFDENTLLKPVVGPFKSVKDFKIGEKIWGIDDFGNKIKTTITGVYDHGMVEGLEVVFDDGYVIVCSPEHKFLTEFGQLPIKEIIKKDLGIYSAKSAFKEKQSRRMDGSVRRNKSLYSFANGHSSKKMSKMYSFKSYPSQRKNLHGPLRYAVYKNSPEKQTSAQMRRVPNKYSQKQISTDKQVVGGESRKSPRTWKKCGRSQKKMGDRESRIIGGAKEKWNPGFGRVSKKHFVRTTSGVGKDSLCRDGRKETRSEVAKEAPYCMANGESRAGFRNSTSHAPFPPTQTFKTGNIRDRCWDNGLGISSYSMSRGREAGGFCVTKSKDLDRSGWVLPFLPAQETQEFITGESETRRNVVAGSIATRGCDTHSFKYGGFSSQGEGFASYLEELAYAHAPLSSTGSLAMRKVVQVRSVGKRRMYDLGVSHPKHNFILPNGMVTSNCTPARHKPEKSRVTIYRSQKLLRAISEDAFDSLDTSIKEKYVRDEGHWGCLNNCSLFAACKGYLVNQTSTSPMLKSIPHIESQMRINDPEKANAQLLCNKPSKEGMVYPYLDQEIHFKSPAQIAEMITGDEFNKNFTYNELIILAQGLDCKFVGGMDHGYTHNFAVCVGFIYGNKLFMIEAFAYPGLEISQKIDICNEKIKHFEPILYPDPADPGARKSFNNAGFRCKEFKKGKGSVVEGIDCVRAKITPSMGRSPEIYFIKGHDGVLQLFNELSKYHWIVGTDEKVTDIPDDDQDDQCFTEETEALTKNGWKFIKDLTLNDTVCAVTENGDDLWENPIKIINKEYEGTLIKSSHNHLDFTATEDHRHAVMTQTDWKIKHNYKLQKLEVKDMFGEMYWANNLNKWSEGPGLFLQGADEAWITGFWLAEGCFDTNRPTFLLFDQKKPQHQKTFREKISKLGWRYSETLRENGCIRFVVSGQGNRRTDWYSRFDSGAINKKLDISDILQMSKPEREAFWEGYMSGDGCRTQSAWHYDSISPKLIEGIQILSMTLGYGCRIVSYDCMKAGRPINRMASHKKQYYGAKSYRGHVLRRRPVAHIQKKDFKILLNQKTQVYCLRTSTGYFLARTNGKPFVAGQCDAFRYLIMNEFPLKNRANQIGVASNKNEPVKEEVQGMTTDNFITQHLNELGVQRSSEEFTQGDKSKKSTIKWII